VDSRNLAGFGRSALIPKPYVHRAAEGRWRHPDELVLSK